MDELSPRARALLAAAHGADDPIPGDVTRVRRGVLLRIGSAGFGATVFSFSLQRAQAFLGLTAPKFVAVVALAVGGSAAYQHALRIRAPEPHAPVSMVVTAKTAAPVSANAAPVVELVLAPELPMLAQAGVSPQRAPKHQAPRKALVQPPGASSLDAEMRSVRGADTALRSGNLGAAQGLLDEHAREFPSGALAEEREGLRIVLGCQTQSSEGKRAAARFLERAPHSLLAGRVRAACPQLTSSSGGG